ncbi:hypothetical protein GCM10010211_24940 [Streptomyces albospinus]|uniref:DUF4232 domain-containing protein n=1 Tax=Streptomyces albospinus TaxID=285515 RepID=A0ABQ2UXM1_9ACTN|nr:DUF4232 domain-containing protein [Streptomyces albospinus]GGU59073.1 hypothetical protein GCM10010211_24940 [Streptomyces albospinus]
MTARRTTACAALALGLAGSLALTGCNSSKTHKSSSSASKSKHRIVGGAAAGAGAGAGAGAAARRNGRTTSCSLSTSRLQFNQQTGPKGYVSVRYRNSSSTLSCTLYGAPLLSFNQAKTPLPPVKEGWSHQVTLRPRDTAYAVIPTNTPAALGTRQENVAVRFARSTGSPVTFDFAEKRDVISVGRSKVSDWNSSLSGARLEAGVGN